MYTVKSIKRRKGDTWDWVLVVDEAEVKVSVTTPGATRTGMRQRAAAKCQAMNEFYGLKKRANGKNNYQQSMRDGLFEQNVYKKE